MRIATPLMGDAHTEGIRHVPLGTPIAVCTAKWQQSQPITYVRSAIILRVLVARSSDAAELSGARTRTGDRYPNTLPVAYIQHWFPARPTARPRRWIAPPT